MIERIVYVSAAAPGLSLAEVFGIIRGAHAHNAAAGVSGGLVFLDAWFAQLLEGPAAALAALLPRLAADPRHGAFGLRARERALAPLFPGQPMALRTQACLEPRLLEDFGYCPGFPTARFPADVLTEFLMRACRPRAAARDGLDSARGAI